MLLNVLNEIIFVYTFMLSKLLTFYQYAYLHFLKFKSIPLVLLP